MKEIILFHILVINLIKSIKRSSNYFKDNMNYFRCNNNLILQYCNNNNNHNNFYIIFIKINFNNHNLNRLKIFH